MQPTTNAKSIPTETESTTPRDRGRETSNGGRKERGRDSSALISRVLLGLVCAHVGAFVVMSVYTQRRMDDVDIKLSLTQQDGEETRRLVHTLYQLTEDLDSGGRERGGERGPDGGHRFYPHVSKRDAAGPVESLTTLQATAAKRACRQEVAEVLKQLFDVTLQADDQSKREALRVRIDTWAEALTKVADDRQKRQAAGNELGGIFGEIANAEVGIFERYCGNASKICLPGAKGEAGVPGQLGPLGPKGERGSVGPKGDRGVDGLTGPKGDMGARGDKGDAGYSGPPGPKGSLGTAGMPGLRGVTGGKGEAGPQGASGQAGTPGDKGDRGEKGTNGYSGPPGPKGSDGLAGMPGMRGPKGDKGTEGVKGEQGTPGTPGQPGTDGQDGRDGNKGDKGDKGGEGARGPNGYSGPPGPKGSPGIAGMPGLHGVAGDKGEAGQTGQAGPQGAMGVKGDMGQAGRPGQDGQKGERGVSGYSGPPGPKGSSGYPGVPGGRGPKGESGEWKPGMNSCCTDLSKPKFTTATEQVTLRENQSVALTCGAQSFPPATVTWGPRDTLRDGRFQIRGHDLVISDTKLSDNGQITCSATNALGTSEKIFDIHVLQHLIVAAQPTNITVTEGQHLQLECRFENKPPPAITWYYVAPNGTRTEVTSGVVQIGGHSVLERARTQVTDKGTYVCEGTNGVETTSLLENVEVLTKPYITESSGPTVVARAGSDVVLRCHSDAHPTPGVHWTHNRNDSHVYEDLNGHLHLMDVRKIDAGQYTCTATNALGQDSKNIQVQVEVPPLANVQPQFSPLKATLFFDCQVTGDPPIKVTWLKEGLPLDVANQARYVVLPDQGTGSHRLLVTGATEADVGRYDCQTSNTFGTHLDTAYVYKDEKAVMCDDTFSICSLTICGGHCPGDCQNSADPVFGTDTYTENSSICRSSIHAGVLGVTESGTVVWMSTAHTAPFTASLRHGVTSMAGGAENLAATPVGLDSTNH